MVWITALQAAGLSHSEIPGSKAICAYPELIAACHVLHRLREPRHPPDALTCFRILKVKSKSGQWTIRFRTWSASEFFTFRYSLFP